MAALSRKARYVDSDTAGILIEGTTRFFMEDVKREREQTPLLRTGFGSYQQELKRSTEECIQILREERRKNPMLDAACDEAERKWGAQNTYDIVKGAYTIEGPLYRAFNQQTRRLSTIFEWDKFSFKGMWLLLHKAPWRLDGSAAMHVYRGCSIPFRATVGSVIKFKQFTSTSADRETALGFLLAGTNSPRHSTLFDIEISAGLYLGDCSDYPGEEEYLAQPHEGFEVIDVRNDKTGVAIIFLRQKQLSLPF